MPRRVVGVGGCFPQGDTRIYWSGGLFASTGVPLTTGGFVDLQSLLYAWILNSTGALSLPSPDRIPKCECTDTATGEQTEDFRRCRQEEVLLKVLMPQWPYAGTLPDALPAGTPRGCLGRVSGLLPISVREAPILGGGRCESESEAARGSPIAQRGEGGGQRYGFSSHSGIERRLVLDTCAATASRLM